MRKVFVVFILFFCFSLLYSCEDKKSDNVKYKLNVINDYNVEISDLEEEYYEGTNIKVSLTVPCEIAYLLKLNDEFLTISETLSDAEFYPKFYTYIYEFKMPKEESTLEVYYVDEVYNCEKGMHHWDEGVPDHSSSLALPPIIYSCVLCGETRKFFPELNPDINIHTHNYVNGICECGKTNEDKFKLIITDNFNLLRGDLSEYYSPGDVVRVYIKFLSGPRVSVMVNNSLIYPKGIADGFPYCEFIMPNEDVNLIILWNYLVNYPCENNIHLWDNGIIVFETTTNGVYKLYTCSKCGNKKFEELRVPPHNCDIEGHAWNEGQYELYPWDGCEPQIVYTCSVCEVKSYSNSNELEKYSLIVDETAKDVEVIGAPEKYSPGMIVTLRTPTLIDADYLVFLNGEIITKNVNNTNETYNEYIFIMPDCDAVISCMIVNGFLPSVQEIYKDYMEQCFETDDIELIKHKTYETNQEPGSLAEITYSNKLSDFIKIRNLFNTPLIYSVNIGLDEVSNRKVDEYTVYLKNGETYNIKFYDKIYYNNTGYYIVVNLPEFELDTMKCFSFITNGENPTAETRFGEVSSNIKIMNLDEVEFIVQDNPLIDIDNVMYVIDASFGKITVRSDGNFYFEKDDGPIETYYLVHYSKDSPLTFIGISNH